MKSIEGGLVGTLPSKMGPFTYETTERMTGCVLIVVRSSLGASCICLKGLMVSVVTFVPHSLADLEELGRLFLFPLEEEL